MENIETILSIAGAALGLLITAVTFISKFINAAKAKKAAEGAAKVGAALVDIIKEAEKFTCFTGEQKKAYAIDKAIEYAASAGVDFDLSAVSADIERLIGLTKAVNVKK